MTSLLTPEIERAETVSRRTDAPMPDAAVDGTALLRQAADRVAPVWPLEHFVAVNPYLGLLEFPWEVAAHRLARVDGGRVTMPRTFYLDGAPAAPTPEPAPVDDAARIPTVADVYGMASGRDWSAMVIEWTSTWAAAHFDLRQAAWSSRAQDGDSPYAAWRTEAMVDRRPELLGVRGARRLVAALPEDPAALVPLALARLGIGAGELELYLHRLALTVPGWVGVARQRGWATGLQGGVDDRAAEVVAVRLAWDLVLHEALGDGAARAAWDAAVARAFPGSSAEAMSPDLREELVLHDAYELAAQDRLLAAISTGGVAATPGRPALQAVFCIDVRSEVFRRALEREHPSVATIGFAGFFGASLEYVPLGHAHGGARCPVLLTPRHVIPESVAGAGVDETSELLGLRLMRRRAAKAWKSFRVAAVSSFAFVETMGLGYALKLVTDTLGITRTVTHPNDDGLDADVRARLVPRIEAEQRDGRSVGMPLADRIAFAAGALRGMSLTEGFARIIVLAGHGSSTVNNPHATGLDCGACGGHTGEANARVAAMVLNDQAVREGLRRMGIGIPADTVFVAALHDTTTDDVTFYETDRLPATHGAEFAEVRAAFVRAGSRSRAERAARLGLDHVADVDAAVRRRSSDWAQVRPEWGLAGCAAFIAAPRHRTAGADLGGRAFLHSYDWRQDEGFGVLELILTAPMVVANWIALQYHGSTVDNARYGSGDKTLHNVAGTLGVLEGSGGDLRSGLPWQSVHDGRRLVHEPVRLSVVVEAPLHAINGIIAAHESVRQLVDHGWVHLFALDDAGRVTHRYVGDLRWNPVAHA
ncbi:MAG TPA: DUF2309 domain-containing protein [Gemmatimonadales bacterium]|nr:DUF2309 domain-containing protein [Gemmatimonadales bacterium]